MDAQHREKFRRMVQYIAAKGRDDDTLGITKLNKLLYFADFAAYRELGSAISEAEYERWPEGPVPHDMNYERQEMESNGAIFLEDCSFGGYTQRHVRTRHQPAMGIFSPEEIAVIDRVIEQYRGMTAAQISALSHEEPGWKLTPDGETIPYETAWLAPTKLTPAKIRLAKELAEKYGLVG